jgi:hypothetical protein
MKPSKDKKCSICKTIFSPFNSLQKYCSPRCSAQALKKQIKKKAQIKKRSKKAQDIAWSKEVKVRDGYRCVYCGSTEYLNAHHIFSRNNLTTRFDLDNGITLCAKHHTFSNEFSAHKTPTEFTYWLEKLKGKEFMENLGQKARNLIK